MSCESENETCLEILVHFFAQNLKDHFSWTDWPIDFIFCMVTSYDHVYWFVKFQETSVSATTQTSLPTQIFQYSVAEEILFEIYWNFAWTITQPMDKCWVSYTAIT